MSFNLNVDIDNVRLDKYLVEKTEFNRSKLQKLFDKGLILINNEKIKKLGLLIKRNDVITILDEQPSQISSIKPYNLNLKLVYEDDYLLVINKQSGILSHPTLYNEPDTLINGLLHYANTKWTPYIVHRLDKDTSGLIIFAKNEEVKAKLDLMFQKRKIIKKYYALVHKKMIKQHLMIDVPISRANDNKMKMIAGIAKNKKEALTEIKVIKTWEKYSLLDVKLHTGRTHQIRVHLQYIGHPIVNDPLYSHIHSNSDYNQYLMAYYLEFKHPITNKPIKLTIDLDDEFKKFINKIDS